jgi:AcrR family transcriptional regulator
MARVESRPSSNPPGAHAPGTAARPKGKRARRTPRQERSQHVVDVILTAAKQLVVRDGVHKLTTNGVARLAGVSIGSLYQYFPGKRAIIEELRRRHQQVGEQIFTSEAVRMMREPIHVAARNFVEKMIAVHREDPALHQALETEGRNHWVGDWERRAIGIVRAYLELHKDELTVQDLDQAAFMVLVTADSITHAAVMERPHFLSDPALVDGLVHMLTSYLTAPRPATHPS